MPGVHTSGFLLNREDVHAMANRRAVFKFGREVPPRDGLSQKSPTPPLSPTTIVDQRLVGHGAETNHDDPIASVCPTRIMSETREKRERKATVEVYTVDSPTKKEFVIAEGKGTKLGDIPNRACQQSHF